MATLQHPLPGYPITGRFGDSRAFLGPLFGPHTGVDWAAPSGTPVRAAAGGRVVKSTNELLTGGGNVIRIEHGGGLETDYVHLFARYVARGQMVSAGMVIGAVGSTGAATGNHLHFEVHVNGAPVDPLPYLGGAAVPNATLAKQPEVKFGELTPQSPPGTFPPDPRDMSGGRCDAANGWRQVSALETFVRPELTGQCSKVSVGDVASGLVGSLLPPLLEPALNLAILAASALLIYAGVRRSLS